MTILADSVLDAALQHIRDAVTPILHLCPSQPANYAAVTSTTLGNKTAPTITAQADRAGGGRQITVAPFTDGTVTATGDGAYWVLVDAAAGGRLLAGAAVTQQTVTLGNPLQMTTPFVVGFPDAV